MRLTVILLALLFTAVGPVQAADSSVQGADHVGLTVTDLKASELFFTKTLGFTVRDRDESYPAVFVSNGHIIITLWRATDPDKAIAFNRKDNVGLHHLAFAVDSFEALDALHQRLANTEGVTIEFSPEPLSGGPTKHMMIREPSGNRLEFIHRP